MKALAQCVIVALLCALAFWAFGGQSPVPAMEIAFDYTASDLSGVESFVVERRDFTAGKWERVLRFHIVFNDTNQAAAYRVGALRN